MFLYSSCVRRVVPDRGKPMTKTFTCRSSVSVSSSASRELREPVNFLLKSCSFKANEDSLVKVSIEIGIRVNQKINKGMLVRDVL